MEKKSKILIVDDTVDTVDLLRKRFRADGYDTEEAYDGEEGLLKAQQWRPDLVVLDVMMPKLTGFEVCCRLKADEMTRFIPVLMLTAKSDIPDKVKGLDVGADDYITKPFDYKELAARVRSLLTKKAATERLAIEQKNDALEHMVDEVAHEVRNPLVAIGGFARRIYESLPVDHRHRQYLEIILQNVAVLEKMVKELVELKTASLSYIEPTNMNQIVLEVLARFNQEIKEKGITMQVLLMEAPPLIPVDRENLRRVIDNILENAIEAMEGEIRILKITSQVNSGYFEIEISDTGKGISRDEIKKIFDPFYSSKIYGPGLGLTLVQKTIQSHKGTVSVASEQGKGSTFTVRLPLRTRGL